APRFFQRRRLSAGILSCALALFAIQIFFSGSRAQSGKVTLISQETSTRAIAVDSVSLKREPFDATSEVAWGNDNRARVMLFAMGLAASTPVDAVTADAEDGSHQIYS